MTSYAGAILAAINIAVVSDADEDGATQGITIDQVQQNGTHGIWQARVRMEGDPRPYRLLLAPADAPIGLPHGGDRITPIDKHFSEAIS